MDFAPRGHLATSENIFDCHDWGGEANGIYWVTATQVAKHPQYTGQPSQKKNNLAPNANCAKSEKPWSRGTNDVLYNFTDHSVCCISNGQRSPGSIGRSSRRPLQGPSPQMHLQHSVRHLAHNTNDSPPTDHLPVLCYQLGPCWAWPRGAGC